jgi:hypothetical protein
VKRRFACLTKLLPVLATLNHTYYSKSIAFWIQLENCVKGRIFYQAHHIHKYLFVLQKANELVLVHVVLNADQA